MKKLRVQENKGPPKTRADRAECRLLKPGMEHTGEGVTEPQVLERQVKDPEFTCLRRLAGPVGGPGSWSGRPRVGWVVRGSFLEERRCAQDGRRWEVLPCAF